MTRGLFHGVVLAEFSDFPRSDDRTRSDDRIAGGDRTRSERTRPCRRGGRCPRAAAE
ncbi:hypothetical protein [Streptomyces indicus]|uniref:hypothetical protein n=1 Tax=Streptomyces indicus TaxID=417292 RepID=UPI0015A42399|nr:hypothetical protein [Streptomyces indicus]